MDSGPLVLTHQPPHPSNPIHKAAMKAQGLGEPPSNPTPSTIPAPATTSHDINKALLVVGAVLLTGAFVWKSYWLRLRNFSIKKHHSKNYKPGVLHQKWDGLSRRFENETHDRADEAGQREAVFLLTSCRAFPMPLPSGFREVVIALITAPMTVQAARTIAETVNP